MVFLPISLQNAEPTGWYLTLKWSYNDPDGAVQTTIMLVLLAFTACRLRGFLGAMV